MEARELILKADELSRRQDLTQAQWSAIAGMAAGGQGVSKLLSRGDCRVSTLLALLRPLGYTLEIRERCSNGQDKRV